MNRITGYQDEWDKIGMRAGNDAPVRLKRFGEEGI